MVLNPPAASQQGCARMDLNAVVATAAAAGGAAANYYTFSRGSTLSVSFVTSVTPGADEADYFRLALKASPAACKDVVSLTWDLMPNAASSFATRYTGYSALYSGGLEPAWITRTAKQRDANGTATHHLWELSFDGMRTWTYRVVREDTGFVVMDGVYDEPQSADHLWPSDESAGGLPAPVLEFRSLTSIEDYVGWTVSNINVTVVPAKSDGEYTCKHL